MSVRPREGKNSRKFQSSDIDLIVTVKKKTLDTSIHVIVEKV
jgi:hypothetical protein